ncbi:efflux transporter outer membrane subunit [Burkholderia sp. Ac-20365]|nr:efflux transporter outer membrane subunit [Burkholderia sp. Ac-20365]
MLAPIWKRAAMATVLGVSLTLVGCASTGGIHAQAEQSDPASLDAGKAIRAADTDAQWPASDWWTVYDDPQLNDWVAMAVSGSPSLAAAQARIREAQAVMGIARSALAPQVNGNMSVQRHGWPDNVFYGPGPLADATTWDNTAALQFSYHLDVWSKDRNGALKALDFAHATAADERAAQLELEANVVRTYVDLSLNYQLLDIANATLDQQKKIAEIAVKRFKGGLGTELEVTQAQTPIPDYERRVDAVEESIALNRNRLAALAGKGPGAGDALKRPSLAMSAPTALPSTIPADLIGHRPDVVAARWTVAAQARGIDVAKAEFYPDINLLASVGGYAAAGPLFQFLKSMSGGWTAGPALSLPIFNGGRLRSQLGAASASYDEAVDDYNQSIVNALKEISDEVVHMRSLQTQQDDAERSVSIAQRNYDLAKKGFTQGLTDYVNVLIAQTQLLHAQESLAKVQAERLNNRASLVVALGGGLAQPSDGPSSDQTLPKASLHPFGLGEKPAEPKASQ